MGYKWKMIPNSPRKSEDFEDLTALTEQSIDFSLLDQGLGFRSPDKMNGTGAVAAGKPRFSNPSAAQTAARATSPVQLPAASPWIRVAAFVLDLAILFAPWIFAFSTVLKNESFAEIGPASSAIALLALYCFSYFLISESLGGQSLGKMLLNLRIVEDDKYEKPVGFGKAVARMALFPLSLGSLGIGLLWAFTDHKRRPWHDRATRTIVRKKAF